VVAGVALSAEAITQLPTRNFRNDYDNNRFGADTFEKILREKSLKKRQPKAEGEDTTAPDYIRIYPR